MPKSRRVSQKQPRVVNRKSVQKPRVQKSVQKPVQKSVQKPVQKAVQKSVQKARMQKPRVQKSVQKPTVQRTRKQNVQEWCDGVLNDIKDINIRKKILQDVNDGFYGDFYERNEPKEEFSDWSDMNDRFPNLPDVSVNGFFEKALTNMHDSIRKKVKLSSLIYEELRIRAKIFLDDICRSLFLKNQSVITPKLVMLSTNVLPLKDGPSESYVVPHDKFKNLFLSIARDWYSTSSYTIDENAFYLIHNIFEKFLNELCKQTIYNSSKNNYFVQSFHIQSSLPIFNNKYSIVPISSNPLARLNSESNFREMINIILQQVHPSLDDISDDALYQLNRLGNAIVKELIDISLYMKNHFDNMGGYRSLIVAARNLFPGELGKHAASEGEKAVKSNGSKLIGKFDGKIDNINLLDKDSVLFLRAVIEYIMVELIELSGNVTIQEKLNTIDTKHINYVTELDEEFYILLNQQLNLYFICPKFVLSKKDEYDDY